MQRVITIGSMVPSSEPVSSLPWSSLPSSSLPSSSSEVSFAETVALAAGVGLAVGFAVSALLGLAGWAFVLAPVSKKNPRKKQKKKAV